MRQLRNFCIHVLRLDGNASNRVAEELSLYDPTLINNSPFAQHWTLCPNAVRDALDYCSAEATRYTAPRRNL